MSNTTRILACWACIAAGMVTIAYGWNQVPYFPFGYVGLMLVFIGILFLGRYSS